MLLNIMYYIFSACIKKLTRFLKPWIVNTQGNIMFLIGMICKPLGLRVSVLLFHSPDGFQVLKCLFRTVAPYNLHPFNIFCNFQIFYKMSYQVRPSIQHIRVYVMDYRLSHKLTGSFFLFNTAILFLANDHIQEHTKP